MPNEQAPRVLRLADAVDDVRYDDVAETLDWTRRQLEEGGVYDEQDFRPTKVVIVMVDERGGAYHVKARPSAMKCSEELALLEVAKQMILRDMLGGA